MAAIYDFIHKALETGLWSMHGSRDISTFSLNVDGDWESDIMSLSCLVGNSAAHIDIYGDRYTSRCRLQEELTSAEDRLYDVNEDLNELDSKLDEYKRTAMYQYNAFVVSVYDGDTITCDIDLGLGVWVRKQKIRLYGIDTPELRGDERAAGLAARDYLREMILDKKVVLKTYKDKKGKYGRWIAKVYLEDVNINEMLIFESHAVLYGE